MEKEIKKSTKTPNEDSDSEEPELQEKDFMDVVFDSSANILSDNFLASKKKLAALNNGKNVISEKIRLKGKALDMINLILMNNKDLEIEEYFHTELKDLFHSSKNDKPLFELTSKK